MKTSQDGIEFVRNLREEFECSFLSLRLDGLGEHEALNRAWDDVLTPVIGCRGDKLEQVAIHLLERISKPEVFSIEMFDWSTDKELLK